MFYSKNYRNLHPSLLSHLWMVMSDWLEPSLFLCSLLLYLSISLLYVYAHCSRSRPSPQAYLFPPLRLWKLIIFSVLLEHTVVLNIPAGFKQTCFNTELVFFLVFLIFKKNCCSDVLLKPCFDNGRFLNKPQKFGKLCWWI